MKISVVCGGSSSEKEISKTSGNAIFNAIKSLNEYDVALIEFEEYSELLKNKNFIESDLIFVALHGEGGEDGRFQGMLDLLGKKYTGSSFYASALAMDKNLSKQIVESIGIKTPKWININDKNYNQIKELNFPIVVKPSKEGSSFGLFIFESYKEYLDNIINILKDFDDLMVEEFIEGQELTVSILGNKVFPIVEIVPKSGIYDYESKYTKGRTKYFCPANIDVELAEKIKQSALTIGQEIGCSGLYRVDFRLKDNGAYYFLEVNTIPGMTETSLAPKAAKQDNINFLMLCRSIIEEAK